jgi:hypothetical protein
VGYGSFHLIERKNTIAGKVDLAGFLTGYLRGRGITPTRVFFPYTDGYRMMEFSAFLTYKGLSVNPALAVDSLSRTSLVFESPLSFPDNHCVDFRPTPCVHADAPLSGDLVVFLPDDTAPPGELAALGEHATPLFEREPFAVSAATRPILSLFRGGSLVSSDKPLPDHWLELHVFRNK